MLENKRSEGNNPHGFCRGMRRGHLKNADILAVVLLLLAEKTRVRECGEKAQGLSIIGSHLCDGVADNGEMSMEDFSLCTSKEMINRKLTRLFMLHKHELFVTLISHDNAHRYKVRNYNVHVAQL